MVISEFNPDNLKPGDKVYVSTHRGWSAFRWDGDTFGYADEGTHNVLALTPFEQFVYSPEIFVDRLELCGVLDAHA